MGPGGLSQGLYSLTFDIAGGVCVLGGVLFNFGGLGWRYELKIHR